MDTIISYNNYIKLFGGLMKDLLNSIYSDSTGYYVSNPYPKRGDTITIKLRIKDNDEVDKIILNYKKLGMVITKDMEIAYKKNGMTYYQAQAECFDEKLNYQFFIIIKDKIYFYTQQRITEYLPDEAKDFQILVDYDAPEWMKNTVFYQIMADRFYNKRPDLTIKPDSYTYQGHNPLNMNWEDEPLEYDDAHCMDFYGGDLYGIIDKLDYLQELGVNGIYLNPIFKSPTMHKYDALDYFEIDPSLGGNEALAALSKAMHERNMRLVLDISINHTSSSSKWFNKTCEFYSKDQGAYHNKESKERGYYFINEDGSYHSWFGVETMPTLNYSSEALRKIIYKDEDSVLKKWLKAPYNIDGWRFDVADVMGRTEEMNVYHELWQEIYSEIKKTKKDAVIIAEEWTDTWYMYNKKEWDTTMNYFQAARPIREFAGERDLFLIRNPYIAGINYKVNANDLKNRILQFLDKVPSQIQYQMFNLINSHDVPRLHNSSKIDFDIYKGAIISLFAIPGAISVYYGDEKFIDGRIETVEGCRYPMDWAEKLDDKKQSIFDLYKLLINLKTKEKALQDGGFRIQVIDEDLIVFYRFTEDDLFTFIWNRHKDKKSFEIDLSILGFANSKSQAIYGVEKIDSKDDKLKIYLPVRTSGVVRCWY